MVAKLPASLSETARSSIRWCKLSLPAEKTRNESRDIRPLGSTPPPAERNAAHIGSSGRSLLFSAFVNCTRVGHCSSCGAPGCCCAASSPACAQKPHQ